MKAKIMKTSIKVTLGGILLVAWLVAAIPLSKLLNKYGDFSYSYTVVMLPLGLLTIISVLGFLFTWGLAGIQHFGGDADQVEKSRNPFVIFGSILLGAVVWVAICAGAAFIIGIFLFWGK